MRNQRNIPLAVLCMLCSAILISLIAAQADAYAGKVCGTNSPCNCGTNCTGGNELFGNSQTVCDNNPGVCFNTLDDCRDGTIVSLNYVKDINISSLNGSVFRVGDTIEIDATLFSSSANSEGVFFVHANASANASVNWSVIYSTTFGVANSNYHIRYNYTLPNRVGEQAIRVIDIFSQVSNLTCGRAINADFPSYSDSDDITFTVLAQPPPMTSFASPTPSNASSQSTVTIIINVTHNETHPDTIVLNFNGTNQSQSYSGAHSVFTKTNLRQGNYTFYVWANDSFGNVNQTETRIVTINPPIDIIVESPGFGNFYATNNISINASVESTLENRTVAWVAYQLNSNANVTITSYPLNVSADLSDLGGILNESLISSSNISQSFMTPASMKVQNISLRLKRAGFPNASVQIRSDASNSPSSTVLASGSIDNSSVTTSFSWVAIRLNQTINLQNNTRYWIFLTPNGSTEDFYSWEANDDGILSTGSLLQNSSRDMLFRIYDTIKYTTSLNGQEGINNFLIYANNSENITVLSSQILFTIDTTPPAVISINESEDPIEMGSTLTILTNLSENTSVSRVVLEFNNTNRTMAQSGNQYSSSISASQLGTNTYSIYMNDTLGNSNKTLSQTFSATDTLGPIIASVSNNPSSELDLDPAILVNVSATITDFFGVGTVILQYKNSSQTDWSNTTMQNSSSLFYGNFTPNAGIWTYRILANDSSGNQNTSSSVPLNISLDYNWTRIPSSLGALSAILGSVATLGNLTINNTGDFLLSFEVSASQAFVSFNKSTPFTLNAQRAETIQVNATTPLTEAEYSVVLTTDAQNASAYPDSLQTNATFAAISSGPYLIVEIVQYNTSVTEGDFFTLVGKVTNIGNETAANTVSNWSVPSGWTTIPAELNLSLGNILVNKFQYHNISVLIESNASIGSQTISLYAQSIDGANNSASKSVSVTSATPEPESDSDSGAGGGGSSSSSSGSGGGGSLIISGKPEYDVTIDAPSRINIMPNQNETILINITNHMQAMSLRNVKISVDGFLMTRMNLEPSSIALINPNENKTVALSIDIPSYLTHQEITLTLSIIGETKKVRVNSTVVESSKFERTVSIVVVVIDITKEAANESLMNAQKTIDELKNLGYETAKLEELLVEAASSFESADYRKARELSEHIVSLKEKALLVSALLEAANQKIGKAQENDIDVDEAVQLLSLAKQLFSKGDFEEAEKIANQVLLLERLTAKTAESRLLHRFGSMISSYWWAILLVAILFGAGTIMTNKKLALQRIAKKLEELQKEEDTILDLTKSTQTSYFKEKLMSDRVYHRSIDQYTKHIAQIEEQKVNLNCKRISLLQKSTKVESLQAEHEAIKQLMKDLQDKYFSHKILTKEAYRLGMQQYQKKQSELEKTIGMAKDEKKAVAEDKIENKKSEQEA